VTRDGHKVSTRPASEIVRTVRNSVSCGYIIARARVCVCVCVVIHTYSQQPLVFHSMYPVFLITGVNK
jgi:hypothetical protein